MINSVSSESINRFLNNYCPFVCRVGKLTKDSGWYMLPEGSSISVNQFRKHLSGEEIYGAKSGGWYKGFACIDLDRRRGQSEKNYRQLVLYIKELFQCPSLLLTSSESLNCHCYLFFNKKDPAVIESRIRHMLLSHGIKIKSGFVELYVSNNLRLPFSPGSCILDSNFNAIGMSLEDQIDLFSSYLEKTDLPSIYKATPNLSVTKEQYAASNDDFSQEVRELIENGLPHEGTRNDASLKYARHLRKNGYSIEEIENCLIEFIDRNGHKSKDYKESPLKAYKKAQDIAKSVSKHQSLSKELDECRLDKGACELIIEDLGHFTYNNQLSVFKLLQFIKRRILINSNSILALSLNFLKKGFGLNSSNYGYVIHSLKELELLEEIERGNNELGQARLFKWVGPRFVETSGYKDFNEFLIENKHLNLYTNYIVKNRIIDYGV